MAWERFRVNAPARAARFVDKREPDRAPAGSATRSRDIGDPWSIFALLPHYAEHASFLISEIGFVNACARIGPSQMATSLMRRGVPIGCRRRRLRRRSRPSASTAPGDPCPRAGSTTTSTGWRIPRQLSFRRLVGREATPPGTSSGVSMEASHLPGG